MLTTERLYLDDPWCQDFTATVKGHAEFEGRPSILLDRTLFYPESGGQMSDRGHLGELAVVDVQLDDEGQLHHLVGDGAPPSAGSAVTGRIDMARRRVHMALHTGQHMLSRALLDVARAETVSSRLGETTCTIDLDVALLDPAATADAFARVQEIIDADVEVRAWFPGPEELRALPLRREPKVEREVRVVEVAGFDVSPCGGTHCTRSGQVGLVRLTGVERYKGKTRVSFSAGGRAREELLTESAVLAALARRFTCGALEVGAAIEAQERSLVEAREALARARGGLLEHAASSLVAEMAAAAKPWFFAQLDEQDPEGLRALLPRLVTRPGGVVVLSCPFEGALHVVVGRGPDCAFDCGALFRLARDRLGARGGGKPDRAEGRLPAGADLLPLVVELLGAA